MSFLFYVYICIYKEYLILQKGRVLDILVENRGCVNYGIMGIMILDEQLKGENYDDFQYGKCQLNYYSIYRISIQLRDFIFI